MTVNHNDPMSEQFYADLDHIMERITGIVGEVDATMTIGEIVRLAYLQGIGGHTPWIQPAHQPAFVHQTNRPRWHRRCRIL